ncbi:MAG: cation:proton antiporter [Burkholderiaceae bacterium]|nr:cation:proton antiporter [Burkholderiaceae bacterium]MEB2351678.1 cation:proton antiporter [Burkholderiaceae bacterium]
MEEAHAIPHLRETLLFLGLAGVLVPLLQRLRVNSVLGFLAVGILVGPFGLGRLAADLPLLGWLVFPTLEAVAVLAEVGVMFLMFMIGLELSAERLWAMRRWVFAAGSAQVLASAAVIGLAAAAIGTAPAAALVVGLALSFSSTAVVMQLLSTRRELGTPIGQASFAILLLQDLAVVPVLILVGLLARPGDTPVVASMAIAIGKAAVAIVMIYLLGRVAIRPLFRRMAASRQADTFMALTLLSTLGIASLTWLAGLSMALGALLAGLLLAETEFRHEVEITIDPFRGLLMGLFFLSVGMSIDPLEILRAPVLLLGAVAGLFVLKAIVVATVTRLGRLPTARAIEAGLLLGQGGEFAFIVFGAAMSLGLLEERAGRFLLLVVGLSMFAAPLVAEAGRRLGERVQRAARPSPGVAPMLPGLSGHVVVAGYGRVGQLLGQLFDSQGIAYLAIDPDARLVAGFHAQGRPVFVGDASRGELLRHLGLDDASAIVLTMDHGAATLRAVQSIRREWPRLPILARARDERHALALREAGADTAIPEALESALQLAALALARAGLPGTVLVDLIDHEREQRIASFHGEGHR